MARRRIAIVGGGVAGLTAAYLLSHSADVTVFEAEPRLGGHAHTHRVTGPDGTGLWVDSGFIVHNRKTYPLLTRLFTELGVAVQESEMSLSVSCAGCGLAYAGQHGLGGLAAGLRGGGLRYARMLTEVLRFHRAARRLLAAGSQQAEPTLGEFLAAGGYSAYFIRHFVLPFVAAVWSCPPQAALSYPARYLFAFLNQHGLLSVTGSPPWLTVRGGSRSYVERIAQELATVRAGARVTVVRRMPAGPPEAGTAGSVLVTYEDADGTWTEPYDGIVIATHPDQALRLLADPAPAERDVLGAFRYSLNETILHTDSRLLPASRLVRASWNYALSSCTAADSSVRVSYDMSRLQRLPGARTYVVTLNAPETVAPEHVIAAMSYAHPVYDPASVAAQRRLPELNDGRTAYAGAYHGWGFHEDGCRAGVAAAESLGGHW
ncbi:MAG: FAD-dependent oxidoreductase [Actinomycetota bacterium]|nr:FAD-dependent oxidoreductase [Actinomycetota bacterium]